MPVTATLQVSPDNRRSVVVNGGERLIGVDGFLSRQAFQPGKESAVLTLVQFEEDFHLRRFCAC
jgi:hypothetical protein